ncbi:MAG: hypothetical protein JSV79_13870, partial [Armatimonadota bacterium]
AGLAAVGDRLYVAGATHEQMLAGGETLCHVYDARTARWKRLPDLPAVAGLQMPANNSVVAMEGKPYVVGGVCDMKRLRTTGTVILAGGVTTIDVLEPD